MVSYRTFGRRGQGAFRNAIRGQFTNCVRRCFNLARLAGEAVGAADREGLCQNPDARKPADPVRNQRHKLKNFDKSSRAILPFARINRQQMAFEQNLVDFMSLALF